ncbi:hypothetical protein [Streptomyces rhizosphaericus]|uniref:hypothetical protein n=1 Tax=Streptomyces rhizosphaericus TaxID=114699 RepID=UPI001FD59B4F|nr:hypothetical protein [Streptomyces rhizosphaericus]
MERRHARRPGRQPPPADSSARDSRGSEAGRSHWLRPASLPREFLPVMMDLYRSLSETWTGERHWNAPDLSAAARAVASLTSR